MASHEKRGGRVSGGERTNGERQYEGATMLRNTINDSEKHRVRENPLRACEGIRYYAVCETVMCALLACYGACYTRQDTGNASPILK